MNNVTLKSILKGHTNGVTELVFSPDSTMLASSSALLLNEPDTEIRLWDTSTGSQVHVLRGHTSHVNSLAFCHEGRLLVSRSYDKTVRLWDTKVGQQTALLDDSSIGMIAVSPDGMSLACPHTDNSIHIWDVVSAKKQGILSGHTDRIIGIGYSQDGSLLVSFPSNNDKAVRLWNARKMRLQAILEHTDYVWAYIKFSADGTLLATGSGDKKLRLWDTKNGKLKKVLTPSGILRQFAFHPSGTSVVTVSSDHGGTNPKLDVWEISTGHNLNYIPVTGTLETLFTPDGELLFVTSMHGSIDVIDALAWKKISTLHEDTDGSVHAISSNPYGTMIASSDGTSIRLWTRTVSDINLEKLKKQLESRTAMKPQESENKGWLSRFLRGSVV